MERNYVDLDDLLSLRYSTLPDIDLSLFTDWAELKLSDSVANDNLLILASLGLDSYLIKHEVYRCFDAYLDDLLIARPTENMLLTLSVRHRLKEIAFSISEPDLWDKLTYIKYYNVDCMGFLKNIIDYWSDVHEDFINFHNEDDGFFCQRKTRHKLIPKEQQGTYVRETAIRFLRLFDCDYFNQKMG